MCIIPYICYTLLFYKGKGYCYTRCSNKHNIVKIRRWCIRRKLDEWKVTDICKTIKISRTSFYRYRNKYQKDGFEVLKDKFRRPHTIHSTDRKME